MKYCEYCGKQLENGERCTCPAAAEQATKAAPKKKMILLISAAVAAVILAVAIIAGVSVASKADPFDYITVTFSGYNSNGMADVSFSDDELIEQLIGEEPDSFDDLQKWIAKYDALSQGIVLDYSSLENLSNGDEITVSVQTTGSASSKVSTGERKYIVSGLKEVETVDFFKDISVMFEGISGEAVADISLLADSEYLSDCDFEMEPRAALCSGETVTVTISNVDELAETYGYLPLETAKSFTVPALDEYVHSVEQLPTETICGIAEQYVLDSQKEAEAWFTYSESVYYKTYFCTPLPDGVMTKNNLLLIFIKYDEFIDGEFRQTNYVPLQFQNILQAAAGEVNIEYDDGFTSIFTTEIDSYIEGLEEDYSVTELALDIVTETTPVTETESAEPSVEQEDPAPTEGEPATTEPQNENVSNSGGTSSGVDDLNSPNFDPYNKEGYVYVPGFGYLEIEDGDDEGEGLGSQQAMDGESFWEVLNDPDNEQIGY